ncbi:MAG: isopentenyl transferase family protein, partial [Pseudomonadota bacterium]
MTLHSPPPVVLLMGPTAAGKTDAAMRLAAKFPLRLISVDSAMVYRRMDIGSGKPTPAELAQVPHRLIDIRDPHETFSAADFAQRAQGEIADIARSGG